MVPARSYIYMYNEIVENLIVGRVYKIQRGTRINNVLKRFPVQTDRSSPTSGVTAYFKPVRSIFLVLFIK